jgi:hypothetical protein
MNPAYVGRNEMAGLKGKSGPPGNMNAFKHGLASIQKRREDGIPTEHEENVRQQILEGLEAVVFRRGKLRIMSYDYGGFFKFESRMPLCLLFFLSF